MKKEKKQSETKTGKKTKSIKRYYLRMAKLDSFELNLSKFLKRFFLAAQNRVRFTVNNSSLDFLVSPIRLFCVDILVPVMYGTLDVEQGACLRQYLPALPKGRCV